MSSKGKRKISWLDMTLLAGSVIVAVFLVQQSTSNSQVAASTPVVTPHIVPSRVPAKVVWVTDGDTMDVMLDGKRQTVRLIGIDAPEMARDDSPSQCMGPEAAMTLRRLAYGKTVLLEPDASQSDRDVYDRLLRYVYLPDGSSINLSLLATGESKEYTFAGNPYAYQRIYREKERLARENQSGLWAACL